MQASNLKGDYDRAILDFTEALRLNPNDYQTRNFREIASRDALGRQRGPTSPPNTK
jgi:Flp pilus assembly protein TadD